MTREEALHRVKGYLTDIIPAENYSEVEEIIGALEQTKWIPVSKKNCRKNPVGTDVHLVHLAELLLWVLIITLL